MAQVLHGLIYLHEQGVIHRDIKGANILTTKEGLVKLADFGVATRTTGLHESSVVGTPYWMAPEVIEMSGPTTASDIWSLGCTVIELLEGKPPYHTLQPMPALFRIVNDDHPPLPEGASPVGEIAVRDFLMQCFQKDPNLRVSARKLLKHPWIVNARRSDSVIPIKPTKYDEAVKSVQQWNEALRSPNAGSVRKMTRPAQTSPLPGPRNALGGRTTAVSSNGGLYNGKSRPSGDSLGLTTSFEADDNWDDDFAASISPSALRRPQMKAHDNFSGLLSSDTLKAFASDDADADDDNENWDNNFEGDLTVRSPLHLKDTDPLQTIRPYFPKRADTEEIRTSAPTRSPIRGQSVSSHVSTSRPAASVKPGIQQQLMLASRPAVMYRENSMEDYSDLLAEDDDFFDRDGSGLRKDTVLSPKLFHPSDLQNSPRTSQPQSVSAGGSMKNVRSVSMETKDVSVRRTRSSVEIQRYAEDEDDEDFSDIFGKDHAMLEKPESDSSSEHGTLMLNSKLSNNSWLGDEDDEDDPFAQLEEGFDEMDLQANIARDKYARLCTQVERLVSSLKTSNDDDMLADLSEQLVSVIFTAWSDQANDIQMDVLLESPETKSVIISAHGMLPILEILENCTRRDVILRLLKVVNAASRSEGQY
ncbi:MAG: hypothetical protein M1825_003314 [Sarcosagium campestre]|nr:MAG: hypothetical protein M1825_003314 [Sarcosagium campestre]